MMEEARSLSLGVSIFLLVVGAILTFAVDQGLGKVPGCLDRRVRIGLG
jgi:hypothetical protein